MGEGSAAEAAAGRAGMPRAWRLLGSGGVFPHRPAPPAHRWDGETPEEGGAGHGAEAPQLKEASSWLLISANSWGGRMLLEATSETNHSGWAPP